MEKKDTDPNKEKIHKLTKVLKELNDKYQKIFKDRGVLIEFVKPLLFSLEEFSSTSEITPGSLELQTLNKGFKVFEEAERKKFETKLSDMQAAYREKLEEKEERLNELKKKIKIQDSKQTTTEASSLIARMKKASNPPPPPEESTLQESYENQLSKQKDTIIELRAKILELTGQLNETRAQFVELKKESTKESIKPIDPPCEKKAPAQEPEEQKQETSSLKFSQLQEEYQNYRKKVLTLLAEKDEQIQKLKESVRSSKRTSFKIPERSSALSLRASVNPKSMSAAALYGDEKIAVMELEQKISDLMAVINLHQKTEQDLCKKIRHLERSKTKEDVNYEYIKNIYLKYLAFQYAGSSAEEQQMKQILLELLHVSKMEKDALENFKTSSSSSIWGFLTGFGTKKTSMSNLNESFISSLGPSYSSKDESHKQKAVTESSVEHDFGISP